MTQQTENHPAQILFDLLLNEIRQLVRNEITIVREEIGAITRNKQIPAKPQRFDTAKEAAAELNLSSATVTFVIYAFGHAASRGSPFRGQLRPRLLQIFAGCFERWIQPQRGLEF